jgi:cation diffusion facilitator CzcD-associated flavoprotein CzcO
LDGKVDGCDDSGAFQGTVLHSSQLDKVSKDELRGKSVVIIGSGASGVEAAETALNRGANHCIMLARDDKVPIHIP